MTKKSPRHVLGLQITRAAEASGGRASVESTEQAHCVGLASQRRGAVSRRMQARRAAKAGLDVLLTKAAIDFQNLANEHADALLRQNLEALREAAGLDALLIASFDDRAHDHRARRRRDQPVRDVQSRGAAAASRSSACRTCAIASNTCASSRSATRRSRVATSRPKRRRLAALHIGCRAHHRLRDARSRPASSRCARRCRATAGTRTCT